MTLTLPSPPLSPIDKPMTFDRPSRRGRHPPRRHDTFELLQALVIEHQRLEKQDYEAMLREVPAIRRRSSTSAPKGILVNNNTNQQLLSLPKRHCVVRFAPGPPKVYTSKVQV